MCKWDADIIYFGILIDVYEGAANSCNVNACRLNENKMREVKLEEAIVGARIQNMKNDTSKWVKKCDVNLIYVFSVLYKL